MKKSPELLLAAAIMLTGCAQITYTQPTASDVPIRKWRQEVPVDGALGTVEQNGTAVTITATHACDVREDQTVTRTKTSEAENKSAALDWLIAGLGVAGAGSGAILIADSGSTYSSDKTSRTYNPVGPGKETGYGIGLVAVGAALLAIPVVDVIRANETKVETQEVTIHGEPSERGVACSNRPLADALVQGQVGARLFELGKTNPHGRLASDIDQALGGDFVPRSTSLRMAVKIGDSAIGSLDLAPVFTIREERTWQAADRARCEQAEALGVCDSVRRFIEAYPDGKHGEEARGLLDGAEPKLTQLADDAAWKSADVGACTSGELEDPSAPECSSLRQYLDAFPEGKHAKQAQAALDERGARFTARQEKLQREAVAERQRAEARARAEQRRERAQAIEKCTPQCLMRCSNQFNEGSCVAGCIPLCQDQVREQYQ